MKHIQKSSFAFLFLNIIIISLIPAFYIIIESGILQGKQLEENEKRDSLNQIEALSLIQNTITESVRQTLTTLVALPSFKDNDTETKEYIMKEILWKNPHILNIYDTDTGGQVLLSASEDEIGDLSNCFCVKRALEGAGFSTGEYNELINLTNPVLPYAATIRDRQGRVTGSLVIIYSFTTYLNYYNKLKLPDEVAIQISDHRGRLILGLPELLPSESGRFMNSSQWKQIQESGESGFIENKSPGESSDLLIFKKIRLTELDDPYLYISMYIPEEHIKTPARLYIRKNIARLLAAALFCLFLSILLGHFTIGKKLTALKDTVNRIEEGDFSARINFIRAPLEIEKVASSINSMTHTIELRNRDRDRNEQRLSALINEKDTLLMEVHHRVKNNMQLILSLIHLDKGNYDNVPLFSSKLESRIAAMTSVHELLYQSDSFTSIDIRQFFEQLISLNRNYFPGLEVKLDVEDYQLKLEHAVSIALITNELLSNCAKYGRSSCEESSVKLSFSCKNPDIIFQVADNGQGFPEQFSMEEVSSFGMILIETLVDQIGGSMQITNNSGGTVTIIIPQESCDQTCP